MTAPVFAAHRPTLLRRLFEWRMRGIRVVEIVGAALVAVLVLSVYIAKTSAARESADIGRLEQKIAENRERVRLLRAEAARLESPTRLEALSRQAGLAPVAATRQADEDQLADLKPAPGPAAPTPQLAPATQPSANDQAEEPAQ